MTQHALRFGTDGWRAMLPDTFTLENVHRVAHAVAHVMRTDPWFVRGGRMPAQPGVVVGYDTRHLSTEAAQAAADEFAAHGFRVYLAGAPAPTPAVALAIGRLDAAGAVMITASHNPPRYNGLKVFGPLGGSAPHAVCRRIEAVLDEGADAGEACAASGAAVEGFDPRPGYLAHLDTLLDRTCLAARPGRVLVDSMHGAGGGWLAEWLRPLGWQVDEIRATPDPDFGGARPEPIMPHLQPLVDAVRGHAYDLGVAHDGDADRVGAVDEHGVFVGPQAIFPLVLRYLIARRGWRGTVAKTVSTTALIDRLCARYNLPLVETPVGFQDIANVLRDDDGLMGGEESGGMSVRGHVPQGDGVLLGLLLCEAVADAGSSLGTLVTDLMRDLGEVHYARHDHALKQPLDKRAVVQRLTQAPPQALAGLKVERIASQDGVKYVLAGGSWLLIRPSGTEPVLRVYAEGPSVGVVERLCEAGYQAVTGLP